MLKTSRCVLCVGLVCLSGLLMSGCGQKDWKAKTFPVTGTVSINGAPAEKLKVVLLKNGGAFDTRGSNPFGVTAADGSFSVMTYAHNDGVPEGEYAVTLVWPMDVHTGGSPDRLKGAFSKREKSVMTFEVKKGSENVMPPIVLKGVKVAPKVEIPQDDPNVPMKPPKL